MPEEFKHFDKHEQKLLNLLYSVRIKMSSTAIANRLKMHWTTVESSLNDLEGRGWVIKQEMSNKTLWQFNFRGYHETKKRNQRGEE